jgi:hypothetical protein
LMVPRGRYRKVAHLYPCFLARKTETPDRIQLSFQRNGHLFSWQAEWKSASHDRVAKRPREAMSLEAMPVPEWQAASAAVKTEEGYSSNHQQLGKSPAHRDSQRRHPLRRELDFSSLGWPELNALCGALGVDVGASSVSKVEVAALIAAKVRAQPWD